MSVHIAGADTIVTCIPMHIITTDMAICTASDTRKTRTTVARLIMKLEVIHNIIDNKTQFIVDGCLVSGKLSMVNDLKNEPNKFFLEIECSEVKSRCYPTEGDPFSVVHITYIE